jgi:hypothetical protein
VRLESEGRAAVLLQRSKPDTKRSEKAGSVAPDRIRMDFSKSLTGDDELPRGTSALDGR